MAERRGGDDRRIDVAEPLDVRGGLGRAALARRAAGLAVGVRDPDARPVRDEIGEDPGAPAPAPREGDFDRTGPPSPATLPNLPPR